MGSPPPRPTAFSASIDKKKKFRCSFSSFKMKFLLRSDKRNAEKHVAANSCNYCEKVFYSYQALGGHLRTHKRESRAQKISNNHARFRKSISGTSTSVDPLPNAQSESSFSVANNNLSPIPDGASFPLGSSNQFCSNETNQLNSSKFLRDNFGNIGTQSLVNPILSCGGGDAEVCPSNCLSSVPHAPPGSHNAAGFPSECTNGAFQNNIDVFGTGGGGAQFYFVHDGQIFQIDYPCFVSFNRDLPPMNDSSAIGSLPPLLHQQSSQNEVFKCENNSGLICEVDKKSRCTDVPGTVDMMSASKNPRISFHSPGKREAEAPKEETLPLTKAMEKSYLGSASFAGAKEDNHSELDLLLHL